MSAVVHQTDSGLGEQEREVASVLYIEATGRVVVESAMDLEGVDGIAERAESVPHLGEGVAKEAVTGSQAPR